MNEAHLITAAVLVIGDEILSGRTQDVNVAPRLTQGVAVMVRSITVRLVEGGIAEDLAAIQKSHPAVSIGSYPFFADAGGPAGTTLVIRGRDGSEVEKAEREILQLALSLGTTPEKTGDSR